MTTTGTGETLMMRFIDSAEHKLALLRDGQVLGDGERMSNPPPLLGKIRAQAATGNPEVAAGFWLIRLLQCLQQEVNE